MDLELFKAEFREGEQTIGSYRVAAWHDYAAGVYRVHIRQPQGIEIVSVKPGDQRTIVDYIGQAPAAMLTFLSPSENPFVQGIQAQLNQQQDFVPSFNLALVTRKQLTPEQALELLAYMKRAMQRNDFTHTSWLA